MGQPMGPNQRRAPGPPLPRPVLPRERGYMDKVVEYLVGDGPSNRFALICKQCQSHNGMALREEFEYIGKSHFSNNIIFSCKEFKFTGIHPNKLIFLCTSVQSRNRFQLIIIHQLLRDLGCLQGFQGTSLNVLQHFFLTKNLIIQEHVHYSRNMYKYCVNRNDL